MRLLQHQQQYVSESFHSIDKSGFMDPSQSSSLLQTPRQPKQGEQGEERTSTARRPRNREVTSRYKISTPTNPSSTVLSSSYRFPTPNSERTIINVSDLPSPRRFQSAERRRPSPSRIVDTKVSINGHSSSSSSGLSSSNGSSTHHIPKLSSTRGFSPSLHCDLPLPSVPPKRIHSANRSKDSSHQAGDHALKPSANTAHRRLILEHRATPSAAEDSDQTENSQPLDNINRPENRRWTGSNGKMFGAALSRSVDFSAERLKQPNKVAPIPVQSKPCYGSSRAPRPVNPSRAFPQPANESQIVCNGLPQQKGNTENKDAKEDLSAKASRKLQESVLCARLPSMEHPQEDQVEPFIPRPTDSSLDSTDDSVIFPVPDDFSETDSMSSVVTTTTTASSRGTSAGRSVRGTTVPARFLQDASARATRSSQSSMNSLRSSMAEPDLAMASARRGGVKSSAVAPMTPDHVLPVSDLVVSGVALSPWAGATNRSLAAQQQSRVSPYRHSTSPSKARTQLPVPSLSQNHHHHQRSSNAAVMLNFGGVDTLKRNGRKGMTQVEETHQYRMLQNRLLQWHFVNAKAEAAMKAQTCAAEKSLYNVCTKTFELQASIAKKRIQLQQARQAQQLKELLSAQLPLLEDWSSVEQQHTTAMDGTIQALNSAVLRIPVSGVKVDILAVKDALESAVDVMNSMENSVNFLLPKAEQTNALMSELAHCVTQERLLLEECSELLGQTSMLEVEECSLRAQLMQLEHEKAVTVGKLMGHSLAA